MLRRHKILCNTCNTLADPICDCGGAAVVTALDEKEFLAVYTDDLSKCALIKVWEDDCGKIHKVTKLRDITEAKVSKL